MHGLIPASEGIFKSDALSDPSVELSLIEIVLQLRLSPSSHKTKGCGVGSSAGQ